MTKDRLTELPDIISSISEGKRVVSLLKQQNEKLKAEVNMFKKLKENLSKDCLTRLEEEVTENEKLKAQLDSAREVLHLVAYGKESGPYSAMHRIRKARAWLEENK